MVIEWRPVLGFEGRYEVSNVGDVRSLTRRAKVLKPLLRKGYYAVALRHGNEPSTSIAIHRLVAIAFVGPAVGQVRHMDGNCLNNRDTNLSWGTALENAADRERHGKTQRGEKHYKAKRTEEDVRRIRMAAANGFGPTAIGRMFGMDKAVSMRS